MISDKEYFLHALLAYSNFENRDIGKNLYKLFEESSRLSSNTFEILKEKNKKFFLKFFQKELNEWEIFYIDDRRYQNKTSSKTSYYSVCFKNSKYLFNIAYRGSEIYPLEEAYLDFIQTDLVFGAGFIPEQFHEGLETYNHILKEFNIQEEKVSLTGHSLGGGIAQFVAVSKFLNSSYIPRTKTFNSIGINRRNIFREEKEEQKLNNYLFINKIINYGHSEDFTNTVFKHFGKSIKLDKNFTSKEVEKKFFLKRINIFNKAFYNYHHEDIFLPFFNINGNLENTINVDFISSSIRNLLKKEKVFENKFLAIYFSTREIDETNTEYIKNSILKALNKEYKILYKKQIIRYLEKVNNNEFKEFYLKLKNKMSSPYETKDIFDSIVFK